jgi:ribosomal protein L37E
MKARGSADWDQVSCMRCGARDFEVTRPGWAEGLRDWLRFGGPWRPIRQVCRRCGTASTTGSFGTLVDSRRGWRSVPMVPVHLFDILRQRRAMIPVPATYLVALVVGAALGVAAQLVLGWRWWLVAAGVVAAVWLVFFSTAFWGGGGSSRSLATEVLRVVRPRRAIERDHRQEVERFRAAPFPLYGLPTSWSGPRHLGGWGERWDQRRRRPVTTALSLAHGQPLAEEGPQLRVEVESYREGEQVRPGGSERRRGLAEELWWEAAPTAHDVAQRWDQVVAAHRRPDSGWSRVTIPVDGRPVGFQWLAEGRHWVAHAELEDRTLTLHGRDLPVGSVELVRVLDLEPYIQGQRRLQEAWARHYAEEH